jgi:hypothetical protein
MQSCQNNAIRQFDCSLSQRKKKRRQSEISVLVSILYSPKGRLTLEIVCLPNLSREQKEHLPKDYVAPPIEGMAKLDDAHPDGIIFIYVGTCDWESSFEYCLKEFVLTVFHEVMHILCPDIDEFVPYAERLLAEIIEG